MSKNEKNSQEPAKMTDLHFPELGATFSVDASKLQKARQQDKRGYATWNAVDSEGEEVAIAGANGNAVTIAILLNDPLTKSKGSKKKIKKLLVASE